MSIPRIFTTFTVILFLAIGVASVLKKRNNQEQVTQIQEDKIPVVMVSEEKKEEVLPHHEVAPEMKPDRIRRFFSRGMDKLPIVETISYTSRVPWLKGRPAWIADYASHYETSRHFIARSLNGKVDYLSQNISPGDKFNVLKLDANIQFYFLVDLSRCVMDFYYLDVNSDERVFIKRYSVGVGRKDSYSPSGSLTPTGKFTLGSKVAIYKPGVEHYFQNQKTHMIEVFGTRWLPFEEEVENCTDSAKGYGIHGVPCIYDQDGDLWVEQEGGVGSYSSDGCIRLKKNDVEELFSIVITKPTIIEIAKDASSVNLPMSKENKDL